jgi:hypothetical protein
MDERSRGSHHLLVRTSEAPHESAFECFDGCGRKLVIRHQPPGLVVLDRGDPRAVHRWADLGVALSSSVTQR